MLHIAVVEREGVHRIKSLDRGFDGVPEIERLSLVARSPCVDAMQTPSVLWRAESGACHSPAQQDWSSVPSRFSQTSGTPSSTRYWYVSS